MYNEGTYNAAKLFESIPQDGSYKAPGEDKGAGAEGGAGEGGTNGGANDANGSGAADAGAGGAGAAAAGSSGAAAGGIDATQAAADAAKGTPDAQAIKLAEEKVLNDLKAKYGITSLDELQKVPGKQETEEEKTTREQRERAAIIQYGVNNNRFTIDEFTNFENMKKQDKLDLGLTEFSKFYKETHKDRLDDDQKPFPVTATEVEEEFATMFHLNSDNPALKAQGEKLLEMFTKSTLGDTESKFNDAAADYRDYQAKEQFYPEFKTFLQGLSAAVPEELVLGEGDDAITIQTKDFNKVAIEKLFATNDTYQRFFDAKGEQKLREAITKEYNKRLISENIDAIRKVAFDVGKSAGLKEGSLAGAKAPFKQEGQQQGSSGQKSIEDLRKEHRQDLARTYGNASR